MKVICVKNNLKEAVSLVERITGKNLTLPILSSLLISAKNNTLKLTSTNLELGIEIIIPAKIEEEGDVAVPADILNNFLSNFSINENIKLNLLNNNLIISTNNTSTLIKSYPVSDFPSLPVIKEEKSFSLPINDFITALRSVYYAASLSVIKPEISSIYIYSSNKDNLIFVATDSFRLAEKTLQYKFDNFTPLLIPYKNIIEIIRVFEDKEGDIKITYDKNQAVFTIEKIRLISRTLEGVFPDYKQIIPTKFTTTVIINKQELIDILRAASVFTGRLNQVDFNTHSKEKILDIKTSNQDLGEYNTSIKSDIEGEDMSASFNYKYIFDCLSHVPSNKVVLKFSGENKPMVIKGDGDNSFQYLVMPMNR